MEYSYPIVNQPLPAAQWSSVTKGVGNGILDEGGFPYQLTSFSNVTNTAVMKCPTAEGKQFGHAILEGFYHRYDADITLSFPAVTSRSTYYVVLQYDPSNVTMPVSLKVVKSLDYTQGKNYLHLYNVTRNANELLTDAAVRMIRPRISSTATYAYMEDLPQAHKTLWGSVAFVHSGRANDDAKIVMSMNDSDGNWYWKTIYDPEREPDWVPVANTTNAQSGASGFSKAIQRTGLTRKLRGRVNRGAGGINYVPNSESGYLFASLGEGDLPAAGFHMWAYGGGGQLVDVEVSRSRAEVRFWVTGTCSYVDLGTIEWQVV